MCMKRKVACLLSLAICFSAGCKKNESEESSGLQVSDTSTEVSDSVKEDPTSSSEDTTVSETVTEVPDIDVKIEQDLAYLPVEVVAEEDYFYPRELTDKDFVQDEEGDLVSIVPGTGDSMDKLRIEGEKYAKIQEMLDALQGPWIEKTLDNYDQKCKELKDLDESSYPDVEGEYYELEIDLYRADTKVITFGYYLRPETDAEDGGSFSGGVDTVVNISAETGKVLTISDVVKDKALFEKVLSEEIRYDEYMDITDDVKKACEQTRHDLIENDKLEFRLFYDRIEVRMKQDAEYYENLDIFSIPVYRYPEVFNLDLFEHVPEYYIITADPEEPVYWDINGDGKLEIIQKTLDSSNDEGSEICILSINDQQLKYEAPSWFGYSFVQADDGRYMYLITDGGADCVRVNDDLSMETLKKSVPFPMNGWEIPTCQDPSHFTKLETVHFLGLSQMFRYWNVIGVNGIPQATSDYYGEYGFTDTSKVELPAVLFDMETKTKGKETKIPKGSTYELIEYDEDGNQALFKITPPKAKDHENDYYAWVEYILNAPETEDAVPMGDIGGVKETDVFDNIAYGG